MLPRAAAMWFSMFNLLMAPLLPFFVFCSCQTDFNTIVDPWAQTWGYAGTVLWDNRRCTGKVGQVAPLFIAGCCKDTCAKLYQSHDCGLKSMPTTSSSQVLWPQVTIGSAPAQQGSLLGGPGGFPTCLTHLRKAWVRWGSLFSVVFPDWCSGCVQRCLSGVLRSWGQDGLRFCWETAEELWPKQRA